MENYWDSFCRKNNRFFGILAMSRILESFYWYCQGDIKESDNILMSGGLMISDLPGMLPCPNCGSIDLKDAYVYIKCNKCLMEGPKSNGGRNDGHADHMDHKLAIEKWNNLPRRNK